MDTRKPHTSKPLDRYLSVIDVWAMAFGCMVGWGVFAMPGTTFLPVAGPLGTMLSMLIGMIIMLIIVTSRSEIIIFFISVSPFLMLLYSLRGTSL